MTLVGFSYPHCLFKIQKNLELFNMFIWICVSLLPRIIHFTSQRCQQKSPFVAYVSLYCYRDILTNRAQLSDMVNSTLRVLREALRFLLSTVCGIIRTYAVVTEQTLCSDAVTPG